MKDLLTLYSIYSPHKTDGEKQIADWIVKRLEQLGITNIKRDGNTLWHFEEGNKILLSAHLDQVSTNGPAVHFYKSKDDIIKAYNKDWQRTSLGADDKNGVWLILKMIEKGSHIDFIISEGEEVGCVGISKIEKHIKESTADIALVLDRKGDKDILKGGSVDVYCDTLAGYLRNYWNFNGSNYAVTTGSISDTRVICKYKESVNLSVNYDGAHTKNETTNWAGLQQTLANLLMLYKDFDNLNYYPTVPDIYVHKEYESKYSRVKSLFEDDDSGEDWYEKYYGVKRYGRY